MSENNVTGIIGAEVTTTGIIGATVAIGQYIVNDYVITIAPVEDDYGYTMTITRGSDTQTVTLYGLSTEQYNSMLGYLQQAQEAAQNAAGSASDAADYMGAAAEMASNATTAASRASSRADAAASYASQAQQSANSAASAKTDAQTARTQAQGYRQAAEDAATRAETAATRAETSAEEITGMTAEAETLEPGSPATASFLDGVLSLGIPAGANGAAGNGIVSIVKTGTSGNIDTYTITYTNGTTSTFTVRNGVDGAVTSVAGKTGAVTLDAGDVAFDDQETYNDGTVGAGLTNLLSHFEYPINLLDLDGTRLGYILQNNGSITSTGGASAATSDFIHLKKGTYTYKSKYSVYGSTVANVPTYDDNKDFIANISGTRADDVVTFTLTDDVYVRLKLYKFDLDVMLVEGSTYPDTFIPYNSFENQTRLANFVKIDGSQINDLGDAIESLGLGEMVNVETQKEITVDNYYITNTGAHGTGGYSATITVQKGEKYKLKCKTGSAIISYIIFNSFGDISRYAGTETWGTVHDYDVEVTIRDTENGGTLTVDSIESSYIGIKQVTETFQIDGAGIIDDSISSSKLSLHPQPNHLYGKIAVFDGDSICNGTSVGQSSPYYGWGWAGRIGTENNMEWHNVGVSGGTITSGLYNGETPRHWISAYINTIYSNYPNADYIILEGGTNDADLLNSDDAKIGTIDPSDFSGNYDNTTFCGALEYLFYNAENLFPYAKIGFIVAPKMGTVYYTRKVRKDFFDLAMEACKKWSVPYLNLWDESGMSPNVPSQYTSGETATNLYTDGQHLTDKGYDFINRKIEAWMQTL